MSDASLHLMIFARAPMPGACKTRLIPELGALGAARLHEALVRHQIVQAMALQTQVPALKIVFYSTGEPLTDAQTRYAAPAITFVDQQEEPGLGMRMSAAFEQYFAHQPTNRQQAKAGVLLPKAVLIGSDAPGLNAAYLAQAFQALDHADVVLGPALDGGYTLIGLKAPAPALFEAIDWGTNKVLAQTMARANATGLHVHTLPALPDIDTPDDLINLPDTLKKYAKPVSVIIPTLNEAQTLEATLASLPLDDASLEVIVVDGGSSDGTPALAERLGVRLLKESGGRGAQLTKGGFAAQMPTLFFLHADTHVPADWRQAIDLLHQPGIGLVSFPLHIRAPDYWAQLIGWGATLRSRLLGMPYGDQGLLITQQNFQKLNGFASIPIMEDLDFVRRARVFGALALHSTPVATAPRRWQALGPLRTTFINQCMLLGYALGISPVRLARFYRSRKATSRP